MVIIFISIILIIIGVIVGLTFWVNYSTHIYMVKSDCEVYAYGSFKEFIKAFNIIKNNSGWNRDNKYPKSFFSPKGYIHASIIKFNDVGMILYPWSYIRFLLFIYKYKYKNQAKHDKNIKQKWFE